MFIGLGCFKLDRLAISDLCRLLRGGIMLTSCDYKHFVPDGTKTTNSSLALCSLLFALCLVFSLCPLRFISDL